MPEIIRLTHSEFLRKVEALQNARDQNGVPLYNEEEIAGFFGQRNAKELEYLVEKARTQHRKNLIRHLTALKKEGCDNTRIAEKMRMTEETVEILLDAEGNRRIDDVKDHEKKIQEELTKAFDRFSKETADNFFRNRPDYDSLF